MFLSKSANLLNSGGIWGVPNFEAYPFVSILFHFVSSCESLARRLQFSVFEQPKCQVATTLTDDMKSRFLSHSWKQLQVCHIFRNPGHYLAGLPQSLQFCCSKFVETDPFCLELKEHFSPGWHLCGLWTVKTEPMKSLTRECEAWKRFRLISANR